MSNAVLTLGQGWFWVDFPTCIPLDLITHIITTGGAIPPDMRRTLPTSRPLAEYKPTERAPPSLISPAGGVALSTQRSDPWALARRLEEQL